eukprot:Awhi_evm1s2100
MGILGKAAKGAMKGAKNKLNKNTPGSSIGIYFNGIDDTDKLIQNDLTNIEAGSSLNGFIDVFVKELPENVDDPLIKVTLTGYHLEYMYRTLVERDENGRETRRDVDKTEEGIFLREKTKLSCPPLHVFPQNADGDYRIRYPVSYGLKENLTESFQMTKFGSFCTSKRSPYVRYGLAVEIKYNGAKKVRSRAKKRPVQIMGRRPTHDEMTKKSQAVKKQDKKGKLQLTAQTDAYCYMEGQTINIECGVNNNTGKQIQIANLALQSFWTYPEGWKESGKDEGAGGKRYRRGDVDSSQTKWHESEVSVENSMIRAMEIPNEDERTLKLSIKIPEALEIRNTQLDTKFGVWRVEHRVVVRILHGMFHNKAITVPIMIMPNPTRYNISPPIAYSPEYSARLAQHVPFQGYELMATTFNMATPVWNYPGPKCVRIELLKGKDIPKMDTF